MWPGYSETTEKECGHADCIGRKELDEDKSNRDV